MNWQIFLAVVGRRGKETAQKNLMIFGFCQMGSCKMPNNLVKYSTIRAKWLFSLLYLP